MPAKLPAFWCDRIRASTIHLTLSLGVAALSALLVFGIWFPYPYREISGGRELFVLVVSVDVVLGPLITLAVFNRAKPIIELRRDMAMVVLIQLTALIYGLWTVTSARPVHMVFEYNRFAVVHAVDVPVQELGRTPDGIVALPLTGPTLLSLRPLKKGKENFDVTMAAIAGVPLSARPFLWQPYAAALPEIQKEAKPVSLLISRFASRADEIDRVLKSSGRSPQTLVYLPLVGRNTFWTVFLDPVSAEVVATMPLDPF